MVLRSTIDTIPLVTPSFSRISVNRSWQLYDHVQHKHDRAITKIESFVARTKDYNFQSRPRPNPFHISSTSSDKAIPVRHTVQKGRVQERLKWAILSTALSFDTSLVDKPMRDRLFHAIIVEQSYLHGYLKPVYNTAYFTRIWLKFQLKIKTDPTALAEQFCVQGYERKDSYINSLCSRFPQLLHKLFRYSIGILGPDSNAARIIDLMKQRAFGLFPNCPMRSNLKLSTRQFRTFFYKFGGKLLRPTSKPRLTDDHKNGRMKWAKKWKDRIEQSDQEVFYCFLDEKWFYCTSRRKKYKILPRAPFETEEEAHVSMPRLRSRRHATKIMCMGIIAKPNPLHNFDGKIYIERVCKEWITTTHSFNLNIAEDYIANHALKKG